MSDPAYYTKTIREYDGNYLLVGPDLNVWMDEYYASIEQRLNEQHEELTALRAEVERLRNWEAFAATEIANQKSSAASLRNEIENRWRAAFDSIGRELDAYEVAMRRMGHDYDASCSEALYDSVRDACNAATLPAPPAKEE